MTEICPKELCTACSACVYSCSKNAISLQEDQWGYRFPTIDVSKCVDCGNCIKHCPNQIRLPFQNPIKAYIALASDIEEQKTSVSGGVASSISRFIIRQGGVVYGCTGVKARHVHHIRVEKESDLSLLKGSKYVQSDLEDTYGKVKQDLLSKRTVLFIGTPCQVAGLKSFLSKAYEHLYTLDFVCHGVPSQQILNDALNEYVPTESNVSVTFREKDKEGHSNYGMFVYGQGGGKICSQSFPKNDYIVGFLQGLYYRESCYNCVYTRISRVSDISVGDYWDRENTINGLPNKTYGLSMLITNNVKGEQLLSDCKEYLCIIDGNIDQFAQRNGQLLRPMKQHPLYDYFRECYLSEGFKNAVSYCLRKDKKEIRRSLLLSKVANWVYRIPFTRSLYSIIKKR